MTPTTRNTTLLVVAAAAVMLITTGIRQVSGLFVLPIISTTGLSIASVSLALAIGQFMWGAMQPVFGALADQYGAFRVVTFGAFLLAIGTVLTTFSHSEIALIATMGVLSAAGAAAGSFSILIGGTARRLDAHQRSTAAGTINAGGSLGQFVMAPLAQGLIATWGWAAAMWTLAVAALGTIPLALPLKEKKVSEGAAGVAASPDAAVQGAPARAAEGGHPGAATRAAEGSAVDATARAATTSTSTLTLREQLRVAARDPSFILLNVGFFTCGFHVAFLVTHFPGEIQNCGLLPSVAANSLAIIGLFNVAGSVGAGMLGSGFA